MGEDGQDAVLVFGELMFIVIQINITCLVNIDFQRFDVCFNIGVFYDFQFFFKYI